MSKRSIKERAKAVLALARKLADHLRLLAAERRATSKRRPDRLLGRVEGEKVARVLDHPELGAGNRSGVGDPLVLMGPVVVPVDEERRPVDARVLRTRRTPTRWGGNFAAI